MWFEPQVLDEIWVPNPLSVLVAGVVIVSKIVVI